MTEPTPKKRAPRKKAAPAVVAPAAPEPTQERVLSTTRPTVIAIVGPDGVGKTTTADALAEALGAHRDSLAEVLRAELSRRNPTLFLADDTVMSWNAALATIGYRAVKDTHPRVRKMLFDVAQELIAKDGPDAITAPLVARMSPGQIYVIDDMRFERELDYLNTHTDLIVLVLEREGVPMTDAVSGTPIWDILRAHQGPEQYVEYWGVTLDAHFSINALVTDDLGLPLKKV